MNNTINEKVSVIIPVYNTVKYLDKCIQSVLNQTYKNIEILLIDDGSDDGSDIICKQYQKKDSRIVLFQQENCGVVSSRNIGIEKANGDYVLFVDSDDWIEDNMVESLIGQIGDADIISSGVFHEISTGMVMRRVDQYEEGRYDSAKFDYILDTMLYDSQLSELQRLTPWIWNKLYRTEILKTIYKELDIKMTYAEDGVMLYKYLLRCHSIVITQDCFYHYCYRNSSAAHKVKKGMLIDINKAYLSLLDNFSSHSLSKSLIKQLQSWITILAIMAINSEMGFSDGIELPEFLVDTDGIKNKKVIIYGAGKMGRDYYLQLNKLGYNVVLWVDSNYEKNSYVSPPESILDCDYDLIIIAVSREEYAREIKETLKKMEIDESKYLWKKAVRIF